MKHDFIEANRHLYGVKLLKPGWGELRFRATSKGAPVSSVTIRVHLRPHKGTQEFEQ